MVHAASDGLAEEVSSGAAEEHGRLGGDPIGASQRYGQADNEADLKTKSS